MNGFRFNDLTTNSYAIFGEGTVPLGRRWKMTGGLRHTTEKKTYDSRFIGIGVPGTVASFREADDLLFDFATGRASIAYDVSKTTTAYATVSRGYKTGGFPRLANDAGFGFPTTPFSEAKTWTYETGVKFRSKNGRSRLDAAAFYNDVKDEHLLVVDAISFNFRPANMDVKSRGLEIEGAVKLSPSFELTGGFGYTDAELVNVSPFIQANTGARDGNRVTNVPEFTANVALDYRAAAPWLSLGPDAEVFANASWQFIGDRPAEVSQQFRSSRLSHDQCASRRRSPERA